MSAIQNSPGFQLARVLATVLNAERSAATVEQGATAQPQTGSTALVTPVAGADAPGTVVSPFDSVPGVVLPSLPGFVSKDEHDRPLQVTLREPTWEEAKEKRYHHDGGMRSERYEILGLPVLDRIARLAEAEYRKTGLEAHRWRWRCAVVVAERIRSALGTRSAGTTAPRFVPRGDPNPPEPSLAVALAQPHASYRDPAQRTFGDCTTAQLVTIGRGARTMWQRRRWDTDWFRWRCAAQVLLSRGYIGKVLHAVEVAA